MKAADGAELGHALDAAADAMDAASAEFDAAADRIMNTHSGSDDLDNDPKMRAALRAVRGHLTDAREHLHKARYLGRRRDRLATILTAGRYARHQ